MTHWHFLHPVVGATIRRIVLGIVVGYIPTTTQPDYNTQYNTTTIHHTIRLQYPIQSDYDTPYNSTTIPNTIRLQYPRGYNTQFITTWDWQGRGFPFRQFLDTLEEDSGYPDDGSILVSPYSGNPLEFPSFFLSWVVKPQLINHCTKKWVVQTQFMT